MAPAYGPVAFDGLGSSLEPASTGLYARSGEINATSDLQRRPPARQIARLRLDGRAQRDDHTNAVMTIGIGSGHGAETHSLFRDLQTCGAALVTFAAAAAAVVALATEGTTAKEWIVNVVAILALIGVLLVIIGWAGERVTHRDPVSEAHADTLLALAATLRDCVIDGRPCEYAQGYRPRQAFHAHYDITSRTLDAWDSRLGTDGACRTALRDRIGAEAHEVARATEGRWSLDSGHIGRIVFGSTIDRATRAGSTPTSRWTRGTGTSPSPAEMMARLSRTGRPELGGVSPGSRAWAGHLSNGQRRRRRR